MSGECCARMIAHHVFQGKFKEFLISIAPLADCYSAGSVCVYHYKPARVAQNAWGREASRLQNAAINSIQTINFGPPCMTFNPLPRS